MYKWYREVQICYVYLSDLHSPEIGYDPILYPSDASNDDTKRLEGVVSSCRWFKRGWTLQELIAPASVLLCDYAWFSIGAKASLRAIIAAATEIPWAVLLGYDENSIFIADTFKWAALREITRLEDQANFLMGLFGVNMPILYGEGKNAFIGL